MTEQEKERAWQLVDKLECSFAEAVEILQEDNEIEHGANPRPLTPEQEKASKDARKTTAKKSPTAYKFTKRERKPNDDKRFLIGEMRRLLETEQVNAENVEVLNIEREILFMFNGKKFKITLSAPRT